MIPATKRAGYKEIGKYKGYRLHEYIRNDMKKPRFIALTDNIMSIPDGTLMAEDNNSVVDLKIKIREIEFGSWGPGLGFWHQANKRQNIRGAARFGPTRPARNGYWRILQ